MANTTAAKKYVRASARRAAVNKSVRSAVKTRITRVRRALGDGELEQAAELAVVAVSNLDIAASKGILHPNNAARRKSRLMKRINAAGAEAPVAEVKTAKKPAAKAGTAKSASKAAAAKKAPAKASGSKPAAKSTAKKSSSKK